MNQIKCDSSTSGWNNLGDEWIEFAQNNESRINFIMPNMIQYLGEVSGKKILDLGCGEGGYSRILSKKGAQLTAVDCSEKVIQYASKRAQQEKLSIKHYVRNSNDLEGIASDSFDMVLCSMMLMDCEDLEGTIREITRVLKPGGQVFASILHPCFNGNYESGIGRQGEGSKRQVVVKNYFEPKEWQESIGNSIIPVVWHHRTLEEYVRTFVKSGLSILDIWEPRATKEQARIAQSMVLLDRIPLYMFWKLKK